MKNGLDYFRCLHVAVQLVLAIGVTIMGAGTIVLLVIIANSHTAEENLINLLLAVQSVALYSKTRNKDKVNKK